MLSMVCIHILGFLCGIEISKCYHRPVFDNKVMRGIGICSLITIMIFFNPADNATNKILVSITTVIVLLIGVVTHSTIQQERKLYGVYYDKQPDIQSNLYSSESGTEMHRQETIQSSNET